MDATQAARTCLEPSSACESVELQVGDDVDVGGVGQVPPYPWSSATWAISEALLPFLRTVMEGPSAEHPATRSGAAAPWLIAGRRSAVGR